jgi:hypothetical protein
MPATAQLSTILRFGDDWRSTHAVLNALATPAGRRFCQPARYSKNRALAEAWVEVRDKWVAVLQTVNPAITADTLPWDNGRFHYYRDFYHAFITADGRYRVSLGKSGFYKSDRAHGHFIIHWDPVTERFEVQ